MSVEWYTPPEIIAPAKRVLGVIDLDPASCTDANRIVGATRFFDTHTDGLSQPWAGNVWLNPPYGAKSTPAWVEKLVSEHLSGTVPEAMLLTYATPDSPWFDILWHFDICFLRKRVRHVRVEKDALVPGPAPRFCSVVTYFGARNTVFREVFGPFGHFGAREC